MYSFGVIMDPIQNIDIKKDSTIAILEALQKNSKIYYILPDSVHMHNQKVYGKIGFLKINRKIKPFYEISNMRLKELTALDCILFRLDPPVDEYYIQLTHILDQMESMGVLIINSSQSLRDFNEKMLGNQLSNKTLPTLITSNKVYINMFLKKYRKIVLKPMNMMAGKGIVLVSNDDLNGQEIIDEMLNQSRRFIICQKYVDAIVKGDTRILITNGVVHKYVLVRYPPKNDFRSYLLYGGKYKNKKINKRHLDILREVAEYLKYNRIYFAGVDMIGDYITEINITSPTGIRQIEGKDKKLSLEIASQFISIVKNYYDRKKQN